MHSRGPRTVDTKFPIQAHLSASWKTGFFYQLHSCLFSVVCGETANDREEYDRSWLNCMCMEGGIAKHASFQFSERSSLLCFWGEDGSRQKFSTFPSENSTCEELRFTASLPLSHVNAHFLSAKFLL